VKLRPQRNCLLALLGFLFGCCPVPQPSCPAPIHPDPQTRAWLARQAPPPYVNRYFELIADEQDAIEKACR